MEWANKVDSNSFIFADDVNSLANGINEAEMKIVQYEQKNNSEILTLKTDFNNKFSEVDAELEKLKNQFTVGYGYMKELVGGITVEVTVSWMGAMIYDKAYTYAIERNGSRAVEWERAKGEDKCSVTVAKALIAVPGNKFCVYDGDNKVCEADIKVYNNMLQLIAAE